MAATVPSDGPDRLASLVTAGATRELLAAVFANAKTMVAWLDLDLRYRWILNPLLGFTPEGVLGRTDFELTPTEPVSAYEALKREVLATGETRHTTITIGTPAGTAHFASVLVPTRDAAGTTTGLFVSCVDRTDEWRLGRLARFYRLRRAVVEALDHTAPGDLMATLCRVVHDIGEFQSVRVLLLSPDGRTLQLRAASGRNLGHEELDVAEHAAVGTPSVVALQSGVPQVYNDVRIDARLERVRLLAEQSDVRAMTVFPLPSDGGRAGVLAVYSPVVDFLNREEVELLESIARFVAYTMVVHDREAERRAAEGVLNGTLARLQRVNRLYAMRAAVAEATTSVHTLEGLYQAACRIAVEQGGFKVAWLGLESVEPNIVTVVAKHGPAADYAQDALVRLDDPEMRHGPTARAFAEGRPQVVDDITADVRMLPWRARAARFGLRASAAFPLRVTERTFGVLNLYAADPGAFTDEEVDLLDALARQLAFAIEARLTEERRRVAEERLLESARAMRKLAIRLEGIREDERSTLARELHDQLGQALTGAKFDLRFLEKRLPADDPEPRERAARIGEAIDGMVALVRRVSSELRPALLDDLGLVAALEWVAQRFASQTGVACHVDGLPSVDLSRDTALVVFRIVQEALTNVARHARAKAVTISVGLRDGSLSVAVRDDGIGATAEQLHAPAALGVLGMRERAEAAGGRLDVHGEPGAGTVVRISVPLGEPGANRP